MHSDASDTDNDDVSGVASVNQLYLLTPDLFSLTQGELGVSCESRDEEALHDRWHHIHFQVLAALDCVPGAAVDGNPLL